MTDHEEIRQLLDNWVIWRDAGDWERFATLWLPEGRMVATWFQASATDFIARARRAWDEGATVYHSLGGTSIDVQGARAIAQSKMQIIQRATVHEVAVEVICNGRFWDALERREGRWGLLLRQPIYEMDRMIPIDPSVSVELEPGLLASFPEGYRHLAYLQSNIGFTVNKNLPGTRGPQIEALHVQGRRWLAGDDSASPGLELDDVLDRTPGGVSFRYELPKTSRIQSMRHDVVAMFPLRHQPRFDLQAKSVNLDRSNNGISMKFNHLRDVLAVAERGSVRAAARQSGIAQSALTRSIRELEKELGVLLFERGAKGTKLTGLGERFIRRAHTIRAEIRRAREEMQQLQGSTQGSIYVALSNVPHFALLPTALPLFRARYPDLQLKIRDTTFRNIEMELRDGVLDCYIGPLPESLVLDGLQSEKLFDNTRYILARRGHPLANARSLRDLVNAKWVTTSITDKAENELVPMFEKYGLPPPQIAVQAQSTLTVFVSVAYSDLLIMLPRQWTEFAFTGSALQKIDVVERLPAPPICIVRRTDIPMTPAAEYFCDLMRRVSSNVYPPADASRSMLRRAGSNKKTASRALGNESASRRNASGKR